MPISDRIQHSTIATLVLAALVVFAGCGMPFSGGNGGTTEPTVTPMNVPTDEPTPTPVPQLAPGLKGTDVTDPFTLAEAHASVLNGSSYTLHRNLTVRYANGTIYTQQTLDAQLAANRTRYYLVGNYSGVPVNGEQVTVKTYSDGERVLEARIVNGDRTYNTIHIPGQESAAAREVLPANLVGDEQIYSLFSAVETRVLNETTLNGTKRYRIIAANVSGEANFRNQYGDPQNATASARIDSRGFVREYSYRYNGTVDEADVTVINRVQYTEIGSTTVERPPWYDTATENTSTATPTERRSDTAVSALINSYRSGVG